MSLSAYAILWFGVCQLGIGTAVVFWSHYYRRHPIPVPGCATHAGHFIYFVVALYGFSSGIAFIWGAIQGGHIEIPQALMSLGLGVLVTIASMSSRRHGKQPGGRGNHVPQH